MNVTKAKRQDPVKNPVRIMSFYCRSLTDFLRAVRSGRSCSARSHHFDPLQFVHCVQQSMWIDSELYFSSRASYARFPWPPAPWHLDSSSFLYTIMAATPPALIVTLFKRIAYSFLLAGSYMAALFGPSIIVRYLRYVASLLLWRRFRPHLEVCSIEVSHIGHQVGHTVEC